MSLKKITIILLTIILCASSISAERFSNLFIAVLQSNGHWEYAKVSDSYNEVWVRIINPNNGCEHKQTWTKVSTPNKPGNTTDRVKDQQNFLEITNSFTSDYLLSENFKFLTHCTDFVVIGNAIQVWHYNDFSGFGFLVQFLMPNNVTEKYCIETFLNCVSDNKLWH